VTIVAIILAFNPGSNSLKFDIVEVQREQRYACEGKCLLSGAIDDIGKKGTIQVSRNGETVHSATISCKDFNEATDSVFSLLKDPESRGHEELPVFELIAIRVVHGGDAFSTAARFSSDVRQQIEAREKLAPLHNANAIRIADVVRRQTPSIPIAVAFDTAFHHTIPEYAWRYPLPRDIADRFGIRKFGFHGLSHRYLLERYAYLTNQPPENISAVTLHLESGSSATAIKNGRSVDNSMGFTPLDGLMMGTRSGSIDPAIVPFLIAETGMAPEEVLNLLEKKSGLLGVSGVSLDTRILRRRDDDHSRQAIEMFGYRVRQFVGAYLAVLQDAGVVIFGGGIGENTPEVRTNVCNGLQSWGVDVDTELNETTMHGDIKISKTSSRIAAWVIHSEEGLQIAHECMQIQ
jgi:acetate kinase